MGNFGWERATVTRDLIIWQTVPDATYSIVILDAPDSWTVALQKHGTPIQTTTGLDTRFSAKQTAHRYQFKLALGAVDATGLTDQFT